MNRVTKKNGIRSLKALTPIVALLLMMTVACESQTENSETATTKNQKELKLGTLLPATGDLSSMGQNMPKGIQLAVDTINACGGVNGSEVIVIYEDSQTDPNAGISAMTKLAEIDRVAGVVGAFASSVSSAVVDIAVRNEIMMVSPASTSPVFTKDAKDGKFNGYWARTAPPDTYQARAIAALAAKRGFQRVTTVVINNDYGVGFEEEFVNSFTKIGGKIAPGSKPVRYDPRAATFDSEARAAFVGNPDAIATALYVETGSILIRAAFELGLSNNVTFLFTDGVYSKDFVEQVGFSNGRSIIAGALGTVPGADGEGLAALTTLWEDKTAQKMAVYVPQSWDAAVLMMLAAQASGVNTGEGIQSQIRQVANAPGKEVSDPCQALELLRNGEEINYQGASGNVDIDENGDVVGTYDIWTVKEDGTLEVIDRVKPVE